MVERMRAEAHVGRRGHEEPVTVGGSAGDEATRAAD
jgi:hypothetical protein